MESGITKSSITIMTLEDALGKSIPLLESLF